VGSIQENGSPRGASAYASSKGGLGALARAIARDYAHEGVQAMQLVTGFVDTELTRDLPGIARDRVLQVVPLRRLPSVEEVAALVLGLAADRGSGFNGRTLRASGGMMEMLI
jgi:NAD(P)-dependent dehydrogenase (short-subunit alcohol dehydrogenase family)